MTSTARTTPVGTKLNDGFSTQIAFAADPDVGFWERTVKPPGLDGGEPIDITTMFNTTYRTFAPRQLKTLTPITCTVAYDPAVFDQILALINVNGWITVHFPDTSTLDFVGFLKSFEPAENAEGNFPLATITIIPTNCLAGTETAPDFSDTGTAT